MQHYKKQFQLEERFKRLNRPFSIEIFDLLPSWEKSPLKYKLMMEEEFAELTISDVQGVNIGLFREELLEKYSKESHPQEKLVLTEANVGELKLTDVRHMSAAQINEFAQYLPPIVFCMIASSEVNKINIDLLNDSQIEALFKVKTNVECLEIDQVNLCIPRLKNKRVLTLLSDKQLLLLSFELIDKTTFKIIFDDARALRLIPKFELKDIYEITELFDYSHWRCLSPKHIVGEGETPGLDFSKIDEKNRREAFRYTFDQKLKLIGELPLETIYATSEFFDYSHWRNLSPKQILGDAETSGLDFSKIDKKNRQEAFKYTFDHKMKLIEELPLETIYAASELFDYSHWRSLKRKQILGDGQTSGIDFSKIDEKNRREAFKYTFDQKMKLIEELPLETIYATSAFFDYSHWRSLKKKQIMGDGQTPGLDFFKIDEKNRRDAFR